MQLEVIYYLKIVELHTSHNTDSVSVKIGAS